MKRLRWLQLVLLPGIGLSLAGDGLPSLAAQISHAGETIVMIRHGEKPLTGVGQISCRGLNRAIALAPLLISRFGRPDAIYAPDPAVQIREQGKGPTYSYVRPLATIEPTAVRLGMPVNTQIAYDNIAELRQALLQPAFAHSLIFVAWEHDLLRQFAQQLLQDYGEGASQLPPWRAWDYGTIYVLHVTRPEGTGKPHVTLTIQQENLEGALSNTCPGSQ